MATCHGLDVSKEEGQVVKAFLVYSEQAAHYDQDLADADVDSATGNLEHNISCCGAHSGVKIREALANTA